MKYCSHCGKELVDEAVVCTACGCSVASKSTTTDDKNILILLIKIFMILGCIGTGLAGFLIPFCWTIPMTIHLLKKLEKNEPISIGFKVCTLLFCSLIAGIMLLCIDTKQDF